MSLPISPSNNNGPYYTSSIPVNTTALGTIPNPPTYIGTTDPSDAPDATSATANNYTASWPYVNSKMPVQLYTDSLVANTQFGTPVLTQATITSNLATNFSLRNNWNSGT